MFVGKQHGKAEEAVRFHVTLFKDGAIIEVEHYGKGEALPEGTVKRAIFSLGGQESMAFDGFLAHNFAFTPATSIFIQCESEEELDRLFAKLSEGGMIHMPLGSYGPSKKFGWLDDRYGVSWQLNLPASM